MVARVNFVRSIGEVLHYHEKKVEVSAAKLLFAAGFPAAAQQLTAKNTLEVFNKLTGQNVRSKCNAMHVSLNFIKEDPLTPGKMIQIAADYMQAIGFDRQPFLVYQHFDAGHPHIHVVSVIIKEGGQRIPTHNLAFKPAREAAMAIEQAYGLHPSPGKHNRHAIQLETVPLHRLHYGEVATWRGISSIVDQVSKNYNYVSLAHFNAILNQFGVMADAGRPGSKLYENRGLVYYLLDDKGDRVGRAIKSSEVYGAPTLKRLEKRFLANQVQRGAYKKRLGYHLDKVLFSDASLEQKQQLLHQQGIRIVFNKDREGNIVGATCIDNGAKAAFNDWELGDEHRFASLLQLVADSSLGLSGSPDPSGRSTGRWDTGADQVISAAALPTGQVHHSAAATTDLSQQQIEGQAHGQPQAIARAQTQFSSASQAEAYPGSELPVIEVVRDPLYYDDDLYKRTLELELSQRQNKNQAQRQGNRLRL